MLSVAERLAGCMMYIKEAIYTIQSQQVQHYWYALLLAPQVTSAIPSTCYTAKRIAAADHRQACLCGTCGALLRWCCTYRIPWCRVVATHHRDVHSVHQYYITEFRYMSRCCCPMHTLVMVMYTGVRQYYIYNRIPVHVVNNHSPHKRAKSHHHLLPYYCIKKVAVLECSDLDLYIYIYIYI